VITAIVFLLTLLPTAACRVSEALPAASDITEGNIDVRAVLEIAASGDANAKSRLENIADAGHSTVSGALAVTILMRWDDALNTYVSNEAVFLPYQPQTPPVKVFAIIQVDVDESRAARSVAVLKIDQPEHQVDVEQFFLNRTYLPARRGGAYVPGKAVVSVKPEVR